MQVRIILASILLLALSACDRQAPPGSPTSAKSAKQAKFASVKKRPMIAHHPAFDLDKWSRVFTLETLTRTDGPRKFSTSSPDDPVDLWKSRGRIISSPSHLCEVEWTRKLYSEEHLGTAVPVDVFLWSTAPAEKPYLTKLGGVPHRDASKSWPKGAKGEP